MARSSSSSKKLRMAFIGAGGIAAAHLNALKKFEDGEITRYALSLFDRGSQISQHIQLFERCCDGTYPALLWAGDLDRDREIDLLINATNHYNVTHPMLFLSSQAEEGRLVEAVAELRSVGC